MHPNCLYQLCWWPELRVKWLSWLMKLWRASPSSDRSSTRPNIMRFSSRKYWTNHPSLIKVRHLRCMLCLKCSLSRLTDVCFLSGRPAGLDSSQGGAVFMGLGRGQSNSALIIPGVQSDRCNRNSGQSEAREEEDGWWKALEETEDWEILKSSSFLLVSWGHFQHIPL